MSDAPEGTRLLFVHAHPDDETLATGLAMAAHARAGHDVHLITCTLGEEGEVIPPELTHLAADRDDVLGPYRRGELRAAMARLGVVEHVLGESGAEPRFRDSGMVGVAANADPRSLLAGDLAAQADLIGAHLRRLAPEVVITYDQTGGYGHPDHVRVHQIVRAAVRALAPTQRPVILVALTPHEWARADRAWLADYLPPDAPARLPGASDPFPPSVVDGAAVDLHVVPDAATRQARDDALREHRSQVSVYDGYYALSNDIAARLTTREGYAAIDPETGAVHPGRPVAFFRARKNQR